MRWAAQRDENEAELVLEAQLAGWAAFKLSAPGWPDVVCVRHGAVKFLEVKRKRGKKTRAQVDLHLRLAANGLTVHVVRTREEVRAALGGRP